MLEDGKHFVNKDKEDDHWKWVSRGVIPVGSPVGEKRKLGTLKDAESEQLKQLELQTRNAHYTPAPRIADARVRFPN